MSKRVVRRQPRGGSSARLRDHVGGLSGGDERAERQMAVQSCQMSSPRRRLVATTWLM